MILVAALAAAAMVVAMVSAGESRAGLIDSYCSPTGDYCTAVANRKGRAKLEISSAAFTDYTVCLKGPGVDSCLDFDMKPGDEGIYSSRVDVGRKFDPRSGRYKARWFYGATKLGPTLKFRLG